MTTPSFSDVLRELAAAESTADFDRVRETINDLPLSLRRDLTPIYLVARRTFELSVGP